MFMRQVIPLFYVISLAGCGDMIVPSPRDAVTHPFGTQPPFTLGTKKAKILEAWGPPEHRIPQGIDELGNSREEWIYKGWIPGLPFDYEYISRTKHLYFNGENLVGCKTEEHSASDEPQMLSPEKPVA